VPSPAHRCESIARADLGISTDGIDGSLVIGGKLDTGPTGYKVRLVHAGR
jgi:hypothetical protein